MSSDPVLPDGDVGEALAALSVPVICGACHLPRVVRLMPDGQVGDVTWCRCPKTAIDLKTPELPDVGTIRAWEDVGRACGRTVLCNCCASVEMTDRSRYGKWFCQPCTDLIRPVNVLSGRVRISLGRHSLVNIIPERELDSLPETSWTAAGILSAKARPPVRSHLFDHADAWTAAQEAMKDHLSRQIAQIVAAARSSGLLKGKEGDDIPMADYLAAADHLPTDHDQAVLDLATAIARATC